jgi:hypothetical protein
MVSITVRRRADSAEGMIERIDRRDGEADVLLLLEDGTDAATTLPSDELDWLELRAGDIVFVQAVH